MFVIIRVRHSALLSICFRLNVPFILSLWLTGNTSLSKYIYTYVYLSLILIIFFLFLRFTLYCRPRRWILSSEERFFLLPVLWSVHDPACLVWTHNTDVKTSLSLSLSLAHFIRCDGALQIAKVARWNTSHPPRGERYIKGLYDNVANQPSAMHASNKALCLISARKIYEHGSTAGLLSRHSFFLRGVFPPDNIHSSESLCERNLSIGTSLFQGHRAIDARDNSTEVVSNELQIGCFLTEYKAHEWSRCELYIMALWFV